MKRRFLAMLLSAAVLAGSIEVPVTRTYAAETDEAAYELNGGEDVSGNAAAGEGDVSDNIVGELSAASDNETFDLPDVSENEQYEEPGVSENAADIGNDVTGNDVADPEPAAADAQENVTATDISTYLTVDASGKITKYDPGAVSIADISIPSTIGSVTITEIGNEVFKDRNEIKTVQLPDTLKTIGAHAFYGSGLTELTIPVSVDEIKVYAFSNCNSLKTVVFGETDAANPTQITFSTGIYSHPYTFTNCTNLSKITLSRRISRVPEYFADGCNQLRTVEWPENLTEIGKYAFNKDTSLTSSDFSKTKLEVIGESAFNGCTALPTAVFPESTLTTIKESAFRNTGMTSNLVIPVSVSYMGPYTFAECAKLTDITFEESLEENPAAITMDKGIYLGTYNFYKCTNLSRMTLCKRIPVIPAYFAYGCTQLKTVEWPENLGEIGKYAFGQNVSLMSSDFSKTKLESVGESAFAGCSALPAAVFPAESFTTIKEEAFREAGMTGKLVLPASVTYIGPYAFADCAKLETVIFEETQEEDPTPITFDKGIYIGAYTFWRCKKMSKITLSRKVSKIPKYFASECDKLTQITTADNVSEIGESAFLCFSNIKTTLYTNSDVVKSYAWASNNRTVIVKSAPVPEVPVIIEITKPISVSLSGQTSLTVGEKTRLSVSVLPADAEDQRLTWSAEGNAVSVDGTGTVTALNEGVAVVTVTSVADPSVKDSLTITVSAEESVEDEDASAEPESGIWAVLYEEDGKNVSAENAYTYTGAAIKPAVHVYYGSKRLYEGTDYTVSYAKNTTAASAGENAGKAVAAGAWDKATPAVVITPKGNLKDKAYVLFSITKKSIDADDVTARDLTLKYTGKALKVSPVVQYNGKTLKFNKDYEIRKLIKDGAEVTEVKEEGTYTVTLSGKDGSNFCEDTEITVTVAQSVAKAAYPSIKKAVVTYGTDETASAKLPDQNYLGTDIPVELDAEQLIVKVKDADKKDVKLENGTDYMISYQNNRKAGTAKLILTGIGDYAGSSLTKTFKINKVTLSKEAVTDGKLVIDGMDGVFAYVKGGVKPLPKVTYQYSTGRSETLVPGKDFTLGYKKNTVRGTDTALVTIKGKGNFAGSVDKSFSIGVQSDGAAIDVQAADVVYKERANNWKTSVVLYDTDGKKLAAGKDYDKTLSFVVVGVPSGSSVKAGLVPGAKTILPVGTTVKVKAKGIGDYEGAVFTGSYRITPYAVNGVTFKIVDQTYTGAPIYPTKDVITITKAPKGVSAENVTYEIVSYGTNTDKGTGTVVVRGTGDFGGYKTIKFKIGQRSIFDWWK